MYWAGVQAREEQIEPDGDWNTWLIQSGRGWGKTRTGAEWIVWQAVNNPNTRWAVVAPTYSDVRDTCIEGVSGIGLFWTDTACQGTGIGRLVRSSSRMGHASNCSQQTNRSDSVAHSIMALG